MTNEAPHIQIPGLDPLASNGAPAGGGHLATETDAERLQAMVAASSELIVITAQLVGADAAVVGAEEAVAIALAQRLSAISLRQSVVERISAIRKETHRAAQLDANAFQQLDAADDTARAMGASLPSSAFAQTGGALSEAMRGAHGGSSFEAARHAATPGWLRARESAAEQVAQVRQHNVSIGLSPDTSTKEDQ